MPKYSDAELYGARSVKCEVDWHEEWLSVHKLIDQVEQKSGMSIEEIIAAFDRGCTLKEPEE